jgi:AP-4 complex subunit epsilon-1
MSTVAGLPPGVLEFALPHAVNLAEAGSSIEERKAGTYCVVSDGLLLPHLLPGYLFCSEIMPPHHDLKLMLVNTLRKVYKIAVQQGVPSQASLGPRG